MRVKSQIPITNESGWLAIANTKNLAELDRESIQFRFSIRKEYKVYRDSKRIVIDSVPRVFKAKSRKGFEYAGTVKALNGEIRIFSVYENEISSFSELVMSSNMLILPVEKGELITWSEQTEGSDAEYTGLLCISDKVRLVLSKPEATRIYELEQLVAKVLRMKGDEKQITLHKIKHELLDMHFDGVKDRRLEMLASAIKLKLPHRGKHSRDEYLGALENKKFERKHY